MDEDEIKPMRFTRDEKKLIMDNPEEYPNLLVLLKKQNEYDFKQ